MRALALLPIAGIALLIAAMRLRTHHAATVPAGARCKTGWARAYLAYLALAAVWCLTGLYTGTAGVMVLYVVTCLVCGVASMWRWDVARRAAGHTRHPGLVSVLRDLVAVATATGLSFLALELPWNDALATINPTGAALELGMIGLFLLSLYFVGQRRGIGVAVGSFALAVVGVTQSFVLEFKGGAIMPSDLLALGTAAAVSGNFSYYLGTGTFLGLAAQAVATCLLSFVVPPHVAEGEANPEGGHAAQGTPWSRSRRGRALLACANVAVALACLWGAHWVAMGTSYYWTYGIGIDFFEAINTYREQGFLTGFMAARQDMPIRVPQDYTPEAAQATEDQLAQAWSATERATGDARRYAMAQSQFSSVQPTVICVMNETFSDLSRIGNLGSYYTGPTYFNSIDDALFQGDLDVSVRGGGTCNTEFEFLTGVPIAYVGTSKYPYTLYDLEGTPTLASQFKALGYSTTAIHPNKASNWDRDEVYPAFGFDRFLSIKDFRGAQELHSGVTDAATYQKIMELLEQDDGPQFIFDVTMQNHSPYDQDNIPEDLLTHYDPSGFTSEQNAQLNEYLSCIQASDADLHAFMDQLRELDRPVVLVFFGDHQPSVSVDYNDGLFPGEDELTHTLRTYKTDYFVWANYEVTADAQQSDEVETSPAYLGSMALKAIGAPLSGYQQASLGARLSMPAVSLMGFKDAEGSWHQASEGAPATDTYDRLAMVTYKEFGSRVSR